MILDNHVFLFHSPFPPADDALGCRGTGSARQVLGIQSTIEATSSGLAPSLRRVADTIQENPAIVLDQTISELAVTCRTSVASIVRFCRAVGLTGYAQLRMALATELGREAAQFGANVLGADIARADSLQQMAAKISSLEMLAIEETISGLDFVTLERVVTAIDAAERVLLFGVGASQFVAQDLHHKLFRIGRNAFLLANSHEAWSAAALPARHTVAIAFSHRGSTPDTVKFLELARKNGALTLAVSSRKDSPLARVADEVLITQARESALRAGAMVSRIAQLALVDCIFSGVARLRYDETIDALERTRAAIENDA